MSWKERKKNKQKNVQNTKNKNFLNKKIINLFLPSPYSSSNLNVRLISRINVLIDGTYTVKKHKPCCQTTENHAERYSESCLGSSLNGLKEDTEAGESSRHLSDILLHGDNRRQSK